MMTNHRRETVWRSVFFFFCTICRLQTRREPAREVCVSWFTHPRLQNTNLILTYSTYLAFGPRAGEARLDSL